MDDVSGDLPTGHPIDDLLADDAHLNDDTSDDDRYLPAGRSRRLSNAARLILVFGTACLIIGTVMFFVFNHLANSLKDDIEAERSTDKSAAARSVYAADPSQYTIGVSECSLADGSPTVTGTILNRTETTRQFLVQVAFTDGSGNELGASAKVVPPVDPGKRSIFTISTQAATEAPTATTTLTSDDLLCEVTVPLP